MLMEVFAERKLPAFRFNLDMFDNYSLNWNKDEFEISDPAGRHCRSSEITAMVFYKGLIPMWQSFDNRQEYHAEKDWLISWLNSWYQKGLLDPEFVDQAVHRIFRNAADQPLDIGGVNVQVIRKRLQRDLVLIMVFYVFIRFLHVNVAAAVHLFGALVRFQK